MMQSEENWRALTETSVAPGTFARRRLTFRVMRDIQREAAGRGQSMLALGLDRLVWRTAAAAAVLALVFRAPCCSMAIGDAVELTALLSNEVDVVAPLASKSDVWRRNPL